MTTLSDITYPYQFFEGLRFTRAKKNPVSPTLCTKKSAEKVAEHYRKDGYLARVKQCRYSGGVAWTVYIRSITRGLSKEEREFRNEQISTKNENAARVKRREAGF